jgi:cytochrome c5
MMKRKPFVTIATLVLPMSLLAACSGGNDNGGPSPSAMPGVEVVRLDARRQDIYDTNCAVCHGMAGTGAPLTGKLSDWQGRSAKGMEVLLNNSMDGFQAMPAMGGCFDCTEEDFRPLITFMTSGLVK